MHIYPFFFPWLPFPLLWPSHADMGDGIMDWGGGKDP